ncbi:MAG TPA: AMP-binding protein, partial [Streptosporangiaceae bacterium]|nr:AMP-binding protein [Streptosporangiaceae bacterium]
MLSLIHVVEWRAAVTGEQIALSDHLGGELSYAGLAARTERAASAFAASGIEPGDVVPILARNQVGWVTAMLGLIRLGALPAAVNWRLSHVEVSALLRLMNEGARFPLVIADTDSEPLAKQALAGLGGAEPAMLTLDAAGPA